MDEKAITRAAEAALGDLELDCAINEVRRSPSGDEWCVQFSGQYGQVCDEFKDQFGKENSARLVREKIKRYLLKQVTKIRNTTGKTKRPRTEPLDARKHKTATSKPFGFLGDVLDRASQIAGSVAESTSGVAVAARDAAAGVADKLTPVRIEVQGISRTKAKQPSQQSKRKLTAARKTTSKGTRKASPTPKQGKKTTGSTAKRGGKNRSAASKKPNKAGGRRSQ